MVTDRHTGGESSACSGPQPGDTEHTTDAQRRLAQAMKHSQDEYWGDRRWTASWNRRTYVEGAFGNLKNPDTENTRRGYFRFTGLPLVTLAMAFAVAASNVRQLRNWHQRTGAGDPAHPLLQTEPEFHGYALLTAEQAAGVDDAYRPPRPRTPSSSRPRNTACASAP